MRDPYEILGLDRSADDAAIKAAYRKLAKKHHPDLHPGDKKSAERFQELNNANDLLSDPEKRARFDRGEIDAEGHEVPPSGPFYRDFRSGPAGSRYSTGQGETAGFTEDDIASFFARHFHGGPHGARGGPEFRMRGEDLNYRSEERRVG